MIFWKCPLDMTGLSLAEWRTMPKAWRDDKWKEFEQHIEDRRPLGLLNEYLKYIKECNTHG